MKRALENRWVFAAIIAVSGVLTVASMNRANAEGSSFSTLAPVVVSAVVIVGLLVWATRVERSRITRQREDETGDSESADRA